MKRFFKNIVFIALFSLIEIPNSFSQYLAGIGNPYIQNYDNKDYKTSENQTWAVLQDKRGVMYFGNSNGLLEFDGTNWRLIEMPNKSLVRSLAIDTNGRVYVGAKDELGYLKADSTGKMQYISLLKIIPKEYLDFKDVWQIISVEKQVIFRTSLQIFILKDNNINIIIPDIKFHTGFKVNNRFYVREWGKGLMKLINDSLKVIPQSEQFANERIYAMLPYDESDILIATKTKGLYIYSPEEKPNRFSKPVRFQKADEFIIKNQIYCGAKLNTEQFVLGTLQNGLIIIDKNGSIIQHLNEKSGLNENMVLSVYVDKYSNVWAGLNNGISYIITNSPFKIINKSYGLNGSVYSATVYHNKIYAGTSLGIFRGGLSKNFTILANTKGACWQFAEIQGNLYSAHYVGILKIDKFIENISIYGNTWTLLELYNYPGFVLAGTSDNGLLLLEYKNGKLSVKHKIKGFDENARWVQEDYEGNIWVSHSNKGVFRLKLNKSLDSVVELNFYNANNGLPANTFNYVFKIIRANKKLILFGTEKGIYKFNSQTNRFNPDEMYNKLLNNEKPVDKFIQDTYGNIYFQQGNEKGVFLLQKDYSYKIKITPFLKIKGLFVENICPVDSSSVFYCTEKGLIQYNPQIKINYNKIFPVIIRKVLVNNKLIFGGTVTNNNIVELPFKKQTLQFSYSALFYEDHNKTQYSYLLKGYDDNWSDWSLKTEKEYTNLFEGSYTFNVKAKNVYEKESPIAQYKFEILPPWYRTIVAYIIYGIFIFIIVWLIVKLNTRRLKKDKENLEKIVQERTAEIVRQKDDIEEKNIELEQQKEEINAQKESISVQAKQLELKNKELEKLSIAASKTDNAIVIMDAEGNFEWVNEGFTRLYNLTFDEFITKRGKNILECAGNEDIKNTLYKCINEKTTVSYEFSYQTKLKEDVWVQTTITPILNDNGDISKLIAIDSDITAIKKAEKEILLQRDEITDSIIYSKHIQDAILPTNEYIKQILPDSFIFYKPKEIIGGDFYWISKQDDKIIIAVADCTGHGVPGALMSMIGITFLNEIIINKQITAPDEILNRLRIRVIKALHQSEEEESSKDGMDIALCVINKKLNILEYAGANNPLFIIQNNELSELSPDKMPVSIHRMKGLFTKSEIKIHSGQTFYLFSDGFADQFGGHENKKFQKSNFKQLLLDTACLPITEQLKKISKSFDNWTGTYEQVDDVTVMGFKID